MTARAGAIAALLVEHRVALLDGPCRCGWRFTTASRAASEHRAHVAAVLDAALAAQEGDQGEAVAAYDAALDAVLARADGGIEFGPSNYLPLVRIVREVRDRRTSGATP